jgi:hypothetical protein
LQAGEILQYVITDYYNNKKSSNKRATPFELVDNKTKTAPGTTYGVQRYIELLVEVAYTKVSFPRFPDMQTGSYISSSSSRILRCFDQFLASIRGASSLGYSQFSAICVKLEDLYLNISILLYLYHSTMNDMALHLCQSLLLF